MYNDQNFSNLVDMTFCNHCVNYFKIRVYLRFYRFSTGQHLCLSHSISLFKFTIIITSSCHNEQSRDINTERIFFKT